MARQHLAALSSSLGGACRETAPALGTASSGMRSPCLPSLLTVRVARQTNRYGCELGWVAKQHFLSRAAAASWSGPSCQEGIAAASPPPLRLGPISLGIPSPTTTPSRATDTHGRVPDYYYDRPPILEPQLLCRAIGHFLGCFLGCFEAMLQIDAS